MYSLLWLSPLSMIILQFIHVAVCTSNLFFLLLSGFLLSGYAAVCLCIQLLRNTWVVSRFRQL